MRTLAYILGFGLYLNFAILGPVLAAAPRPKSAAAIQVVGVGLMALGGMFGWFASYRVGGQGNFSLLTLAILAGIGLLVGVPGWGLYLTGHTLSEFL